MTRTLHILSPHFCGMLSWTVCRTRTLSNCLVGGPQWKTASYYWALVFQPSGRCSPKYFRGLRSETQTQKTVINLSLFPILTCLLQKPSAIGTRQWRRNLLVTLQMTKVTEALLEEFRRKSKMPRLLAILVKDTRGSSNNWPHRIFSSQR
jgi:hypothetical protein